MRCNEEEIGTLWPKPTGNVEISNYVVQIDPNEVKFKRNGFNDKGGYLTAAEERFQDMQRKKIPKHPVNSGGKSLLVESVIEVDDFGIC